MRGLAFVADVLRTTFPRRLRYDAESQLLYADCFALSREHRHRKHIPVADIQAVLRRFTPLPGPTCLRLPLVRHVLLLPLANMVRQWLDKPRWLYARGAVLEHDRIARWLDAQELQARLQRASTTAAYSSSRSSSSSTLTMTSLSSSRVVEREVFDEQVLKPFHVASLYHRTLRMLAVVVALLLAFLAGWTNVDAVVYVYLRYWRGLERPAVLAWFRDVTAQHAAARVPLAYTSRLPTPCVRYTTAEGRSAYAVHVLELVSREKGVTVIVVPFPRIAPTAFYTHVGELARWCHGMLLECVPLEHVVKLTPAFFLPRRADALPTVTGVQYFYYDILRNNSSSSSSSSSSGAVDMEPPLLYPGGRRLGWAATLCWALVPPAMRYVYTPTSVLMSSEEARAGWAWVRDIVDGVAAGYIRTPDADNNDNNNSSNSKSEQPAAAATAIAAATSTAQQRGKQMYVLCVPWTVQHVASIEASLLHYGFTVAHTYRIHWMDEDYLGEHFCDYYNIR